MSQYRSLEKLLKECQSTLKLRDKRIAELEAKQNPRAHPEHKMRKTSIEAFRGLRLSGETEKRYTQIYGVLLRKGEPMTDWEITEELGWTDRNLVSPGRNKLVKYRMVEECEPRKCTSELGTKIKCITWRAVERE